MWLSPRNEADRQSWAYVKKTPGNNLIAGLMAKTVLSFGGT